MRRRVTRQDVADRAGVSTAVVSYVVNNGPRPVAAETRARVEQAIEALGYYPSAAARSLRSQRVGRVGFLLTYTFSSISEYVAPLLSGAIQTVEENDYQLVLYPLTGNPLDLLLRISRANEVDGLLMIEAPQTEQMAALLLKESFPFVALGHSIAHPAASFVASDYQQGARLAVGHLLELGHRRIAFVDLPELATSSSDMWAGYRLSLREAGIEFDESLVVPTQIGEPNSCGVAVDKLLRLADPPTAIITIHDLLAADIARLIESRGLRVPQDVAIIGYNNHPSSIYTVPAMTSLREPLLQIGKQGTEILLARLSDETLPPTRSTLPVTLIVRGSSSIAA